MHRINKENKINLSDSAKKPMITYRDDKGHTRINHQHRHYRNNCYPKRGSFVNLQTNCPRGRKDPLWREHVRLRHFRQASVHHLRGDDAHDAFDTLRHHILGLPILGDHPRPQGKPASQRQIWSAIDRMFDNDGHHPLFIYQDPWMKFFIEIGRTNAQLLTKIKIEGIFMTAKNN
jgi:hypothetical protein